MQKKDRIQVVWKEVMERVRERERDMELMVRNGLRWHREMGTG